MHLSGTSSKTSKKDYGRSFSEGFGIHPSLSNSTKISDILLLFQLFNLISGPSSLFYCQHSLKSHRLMSKGHSDRLTLQQYLQAQKIKRRLQQRNRSRSRGRGSNFQDEQQTSMQSIFQQMNNFLGEAKLDLSELFATTTSKEKILVQTLAKLDKFVLQLKEEIKKMYRDVYTLYMIEHEEAKTGKDESNRIYFEQRLNQAEEQIRKSKLGDVVRDKFKTGEKQKEILDVLVQKVGKKHEELTPYQGRPKQANPSFMEALLGLSTKKEGDNTEGINDNLLSPKKDPKIERKPGLDANQLSPTSKISPRGRILDTRRQVGSKERR